MWYTTKVPEQVSQRLGGIQLMVLGKRIRLRSSDPLVAAMEVEGMISRWRPGQEEDPPPPTRQQRRRRRKPRSA